LLQFSLRSLLPLLENSLLVYSSSVRFRIKNFYKVFFLILVCEAIGTAATPGLLCQPRVIVKMMMEKKMECRFAGETEALGENLPQRHFCPSQNPTWPDPGLHPGRRGGKFTEVKTRSLTNEPASWTNQANYLYIYLWLYSTFVGPWPLFNPIHSR
jgi:hypothetical protein